MTKIRNWLNANNLAIGEQDNICCIYKIESPSGRVYIGSTVNLYNRLSFYCHRFDKKSKEQPKLFNSYYKYGLENHKVEILHLLDRDEKVLEAKEIECINEYNAVVNGLNASKGGRFAGPVSDETKRKQSEAARGRKPSEQTLKKLAEVGLARRGQKFSAESRAKMSKAHTGVPLSDKHKKSMYNALFGENGKYDKKKIKKGIHKWLENGGRESFKKRSIPIIQLNLNGDFVRQAVISELKEEGFKAYGIYKCCNGKQAYSQGFIWKFNKDENKNNKG